MQVFLNIICLVIDPIAIVFMGYILVSEKGRLMAPLGYRIGLAVAIGGLIGQVSWSLHVVLDGTSSVADSMPWWIGKDLGYFIFGAIYLIRHLKKDEDFEKIRDSAEGRMIMAQIKKRNKLD